MGKKMPTTGYAAGRLEDLDADKKMQMLEVRFMNFEERESTIGSLVSG